MIRGIHWFRNDLRLHDNQALAALADRADEWLPIFILDPRLYSDTPARPPRVRFLENCLTQLEDDLARRGVELHLYNGEPQQIIPELMSKTKTTIVSWCRSPSPFAQRRDASVAAAIERVGGQAVEVDDQTVFAPDEIKTKAGGSFSVYTPFRNAWWKRWHEQPRLSATRVQIPRKPIRTDSEPMESRFRSEAARSECEMKLPKGGEAAAKRRLRTFLSGPAARYHVDRDRPDVDGTSRLSPYLRFGVISVRRCFTEGLRRIEKDPKSREGVMKWLDELIWREFYHAVLVHSPHVLSGSYRREYDQLEWAGSASDFEAWCAGRTGYPFVDAGMRQLKATGWMHNRARMVVASFLTKDLLIDWRRGERFFFESLVDGDPASNNGGWQWSASTGTDAQPYFRIFNPVSQGKKCDPNGDYVRKWVPELRHLDSSVIHSPWETSAACPGYPSPIVDHAVQRQRALAEFKRVRAISG